LALVYQDRADIDTDADKVTVKRKDFSSRGGVHEASNICIYL